MNNIHHIGLTVSQLQKSEDFFTQLLDWKLVKRNEAYPASFVSNGVWMISLWQANPDHVTFNRKENIGLHHLALTVDSEEALLALHQKLAATPDINIEFAPESRSAGPGKHFMCYEPSGIRMEFIFIAAP